MKVDLKSKGKFLGEKGTPGAEDMDAGEKVKARTHRGRNWRCGHQPKETWSRWRLEEAGGTPSSFRGSGPCPLLDFCPGDCERTHFCCFKQQTLW